MLPSDLRVENALTIVHFLLERSGASRAEVARATGLSVPAVHRLIDELIRLGLVEEFVTDSPIAPVGRPASSIRFLSSNVILAGVDIGNYETRIILANASLEVIAYHEVATTSLDLDLASTLTKVIQHLMEVWAPNLPLVAVGVGVAATADPETGQFTRGPLKGRFIDHSLRASMTEQLGAKVAIRQDDHLSATAEASALGAFPGVDSLVVLEIGEGIGCGFSLSGATVSGAHGAFGRIAQWPVSTPLPGMPASHSLLGSMLTAPGIVNLYQRLGGDQKVITSRELMTRATTDPIADQVLAWTRSEIAETLSRLAVLLDPTALVLSGGLGRAFQRDVDYFASQLDGKDFKLSELGSRAVALGALMNVRDYLEEWLRGQLSMKSVSRNRLSVVRTKKRKVGS